mmetsp:Transcript_25972/g.47082  ORF Transcript_25972/g.47082 Transcript_25972/m.47082 type:complete len:82 (+) Transcript_25972:725-970(+)
MSQGDVLKTKERKLNNTSRTNVSLQVFCSRVINEKARGQFYAVILCPVMTQVERRAVMGCKNTAYDQLSRNSFFPACRIRL